MSKEKISLVRRDGVRKVYSHSWVRELIRKSGTRSKAEMSGEEIEAAEKRFGKEVQALSKRELSYLEWKCCMSLALEDYPEVRDAFMAAHQQENAQIHDDICDGMSKVARDGDTSSGNLDSSLSSSQRALAVEALEKATYRNFHLNDEQKEALDTGYIYIHDMGYRRNSINCCLFDMASVLENGFPWERCGMKNLIACEVLLM